jgi:pimeloyl-ACP methyl ester carboxylesterase
VKWALALLSGVAILVSGGLVRDWLVGAMLYHPTPGVDVAPAALGIDAREVFLTAEDGVRIHAFHLAHPRATRALLFLHGNAGNASHRLPNAALLQRLGTHVLLLDYRGYGRSEGRPDEAGLYADARAGLAHLEQELGFATGRIVLFGRSLGGAVAVDLARDRDLAGVILESTFSSLSDAAGSVFGRLAAPLVRGRFDSGRKIARVRAPLLFFHGDRDEIVAYDLGRRLFDAAPGSKAFETLRGARHNDTVEVGGRAYFERIGRFLDEVAPEGASGQGR